MHKEARGKLRIRFKVVILEHADHFGVTKACREFNAYGLKTSTDESKNKYTGFPAIYEQKSKLTMLEIWRVTLHGVWGFAE